MDDFNQSIPNIQQSISKYIKRVNEIYKATIFKDAPNERIHFTIGKWVRLQNFARHPDDSSKLCENHGIVLSEFSHVRMFTCTIFIAFLTLNKIPSKGFLTINTIQFILRQ